MRLEQVKEYLLENEEKLAKVIEDFEANTTGGIYTLCFKEGGGLSLKYLISELDNETAGKLIKFYFSDRNDKEHFTCVDGEFKSVTPREYLNYCDYTIDTLLGWITEYDDNLFKLPAEIFYHVKKYIENLHVDNMEVQYDDDYSCRFLMPRYAPAEVIEQMIKALERHLEYLRKRG